MSAAHDRLRAAAKRLIAENGRSISLSERTDTLSDPAKPWGSVADTESTTLTNTIGVFMSEGASDLEARLSAVSRLVLSPVEVNESKVLIAAQGLGVVPTTKMKLVDGGRSLEIKKVMVEAPGDVAILYTLVVEN
jgi:hypothetical protein